jgi:ribonuclease III
MACESFDSKLLAIGAASMESTKSFIARLFRKVPLPKEEVQLLQELEDRLGFHFRNLSLLKKALSHKSFINEKRLTDLDHNERLEFLGDAVLELGVSDLLMHHFPASREGDMSKLRASLVNETALAEVAREIQIGNYLFLGKGEEQSQGRDRNSLLADAFEAMLGAMYLDSGFDKVFAIIKKLFLPTIIKATTEDINRDFKTKLQEEAQNRFKTVPHYQLINESGPDHDKTFEVHLTVAGRQIGVGNGKSKKQAEQNAAQNALTTLAEESDV